MPSTLPSTTSSLQHQAAVLLRQGRYRQALALAEQACREASEGSPELAVALGQCAEAHRELGELSQAEPLCLRALNLRATRGKETPEYTAALGELGRLYEAMGNYKQAETLYRSALELARRTLPAGHADLTRSLNDLGALLDLFDRQDEAEPLLREALEISRRAVGEADPLHARTLGNLAHLAMKRRRNHEGEELARRAGDVYRKAFGEEHPGYARLLNLLAGILVNRGRCLEAEELATRSVELRGRLLGEGHYEYAGSLERLAMVRALLHPDQAAANEEMARRALVITRQALGEKHYYFLGSLLALAFVLHRAGNHAEAETVYGQALALSRGQFGETVSLTATILTDLAEVRAAEGRLDDAESTLAEALTLLGEEEDPIDRVVTQLTLADVQLRRGDHALAGMTGQEALELARRSCAGRSIIQAHALIAYGSLLMTAGEQAAAEPLFREALALSRADEAEQSVRAEALRGLSAARHAVGDLAETETLARELLEVLRRNFGQAHPTSMEWARTLARVLQERGDTSAAEALWEQLLDVERRRAGEKSAGFARVLRELAVFYQETGNPAAAEVRYRQVLGTRIELEGEEHPDVAESCSDLASLFQQTGNLAAAEQLYRRALELRRANPGEHSPEFAQSLYEVALVCHASHRLDEAGTLFTQALEVQRAAEGEQTPAFVAMLHSSALLLRDRGEHDQAESELRRALELARSLYGPASGARTSLLNDLARLLDQAGDHLAAEPVLREVESINRTSKGEKHPDHAADLHNLSMLYRALGDFARAQPLARQAVDVFQGALGESHPQSAACLASLARLYGAMEEYDKAEELYRRVLHIYRTAAGPQHPLVAAALIELAQLHQTEGRWDEAEEHHREALEIIRRSLGENHFEYVNGLRVLFTFYRARGKKAEAAPLLRQHLEITKRLCPENHPLIAMSLQLRALAEREERDFVRAEATYQQAIALVRRSTLPEPGPVFALSLRKGLAGIYLAQGKHAAAESLLRQLLNPETGNLGEEHPEQLGTCFLLASLCAVTGREAEAATLLERLLDLSGRFLPAVLALHAPQARAACWQEAHDLHGVYLALITRHLADSPEGAGKAFDVLLRSKALWVELLAASRKEVLERRHPEQQPRVAELYFLRRQIAQVRWMTPGPEARGTQRLLSEWERRAERLETELAHQVPAIATERRLRNASRATLAAALPEGSVLIEYVRLSDYDFASFLAQVPPASPAPQRYLAFVLPAGRPDAFRLIDLGDAAVIDTLVEQYRQAIRGATGFRRAAKVSTAGSALRAAVFDPVVPTLGGCTRIVLAPDGALLRVSLAALPADNDAFLCDRYSISLVQTGRDLLRPAPALESPPSPPPRKSDPAFAGGPFPSSARKATLWDRVRFLAARWMSPVSDPAPPAIAHLAGGSPPRTLSLPLPVFLPLEETPKGARPGQAEPVKWDNLLRKAGLIFPGPNRDAAEQRLTAWDVTRLDFTGTEVYLFPTESSALDSHVERSELLLPRSFLLAGVRSLVMTLWPVPARARHVFLTALHERQQAGLANGAACRAARERLRSLYPDPKVWGAVIWYGDV